MSVLKIPVSVTEGRIDSICPLAGLIWRQKSDTPETEQSDSFSGKLAGYGALEEALESVTVVLPSLRGLSFLLKHN